MTNAAGSSRTEVVATLLGGRYALGDVIGQGGMATVFRAVDQHTSSTVAIKLFHPGIEMADSLPRRRREVEMASALDHPAIVKILDANVDVSHRSAHRAYIVTELVNGPTLGQRLRHRVLTERQVAGMGAVICDALAYMHQAGIVHRDLKPANILLADEQSEGPLRPKLADFGLAYMVDSTRMTGTGLTAGTPNYLSPEQVRGRPITPASDIYSLGLVLIEALTGAPAFPGHGIEAALARLSNDPSLPDDVEPRMRSVLLAMTAADTARRLSAAQAQAELDALAGGHSIASQLIAIGPDAPGSVSRSRSRPAGLAASALALVGAGIVAAVAFALTNYLGPESHAPDASISDVISSPATAPAPAPMQPLSATAASTPTSLPPAGVPSGPQASSPTATATPTLVRAPNQPENKGQGKKPGSHK